MINSRKLSDLRPDVRANAELLLAECERQGLRVLVTQTLRDDEYQARLYAQGRTLPGQIVTNSKVTTFHGAGLAFDICQNIKGQEYSDPAFFRNVAIIAKHMGFSWGGDWKTFPDRPHFQWDADGKWSGSLLRAKILPPMMPLYKPGTPKEVEKEMVYYKTLKDVPEWGQAAVRKCILSKALTGDGKGNYNISEDLLRVLVILDRMGKL